MKIVYCSKCGTRIKSGNNYCHKCGCKTFKSVPKTGKKAANPTKIEIACFVLMVASCIIFGFLVIPLIWMVPMTKNYYTKIMNREEITNAFIICCIFFLNIIAGLILFLTVADEE